MAEYQRGYRQGLQDARDALDEVIKEYDAAAAAEAKPKRERAENGAFVSSKPNLPNAQYSEGIFYAPAGWKGLDANGKTAPPDGVDFRLTFASGKTILAYNLTPSAQRGELTPNTYKPAVYVWDAAAEALRYRPAGTKVKFNFAGFAPVRLGAKQIERGRQCAL